MSRPQPTAALTAAALVLGCAVARRCSGSVEPEPDQQTKKQGRAQLPAADTVDVNLAVSVVHTHVSRVLAYLRAEVLLPASPLYGIEVLGVPAGSSAKQKKGKSWSDIPILLVVPGGAAGAAAAAGALADDQTLSCAVRKTFVLEPAEAGADLLSMQAAAEALAVQLDGATVMKSGSTPFGVRVQAYPATLLPRLLEALHARDPASQAASAALWALSPQNCELVASVVRLPSSAAHRTGVSTPEAYVGKSRQSRGADGDGEAVCRAYFKLQEVAICIKIDEFCTKNDGVCIENDEFNANI